MFFVSLQSVSVVGPALRRVVFEVASCKKSYSFLLSPQACLKGEIASKSDP